MLYKNKTILIGLACFLFGSCEDISNLSSQIDKIKDTQNQILSQQDKILKSLAALDKKVSAAPPKKNDNKNNKRKTPNPDFAHKIDIGNSVVLGNPDASVTVTKFTDFQWPYCARSVSLIDEVLAKYPNDVKVVIKNFPLGSHKQARKAAQYALAAHKQGKYKEMYHKIFENYRELRNNEDLPKQYAAELGLDVARLMEDMNDKTITDLIDWEYDQLRGMKGAYKATDKYEFRLAVPKFFINGKEPLSRSLDAFSAIIEKELKN